MVKYSNKIKIKVCLKSMKSQLTWYLVQLKEKKIRRETFRWNCISFMLTKSCKYEMQRIRNHLKWMPGPRTQNLSSIYLLYETKGYESRNSIRAGLCVAVINWKKWSSKVWLFSRLYLCLERVRLLLSFLPICLCYLKSPWTSFSFHHKRGYSYTKVQF